MKVTKLSGPLKDAVASGEIALEKMSNQRLLEEAAKLSK